MPYSQINRTRESQRVYIRQYVYVTVDVSVSSVYTRIMIILRTQLETRDAIKRHLIRHKMILIFDAAGYTMQKAGIQKTFFENPKC